jgi:hypothetical protein
MSSVSSTPIAPLVGHERLEARDALLAHARLHLGLRLVAEPGDGHMERVVGDGLPRLLVPLIEPVEQRLVAVRDHEVDDRRRAAMGRGDRACFEVVG